MPPREPITAAKHLDAFCRFAGAATALVGAAVLTGWALNVEALKSVWVGGITMKANTALAFVFAGAALWLQAAMALPGTGPKPEKTRIGRRLAQALAAIVLLIGLVALAEYFFNWEPGIDQWFFTEAAGAVGTSHAGRMAPQSALCFVAAGAALLVLLRGSVRLGIGLRVLVKGAAGAVASLGVLALLGYTAGVTVGYRWWSFTGMAFSTAALFVLLGGGLMAAARRHSPTPWVVRKGETLAFGVGLAVLLVLLGMIFRATGKMESTARWVAHTHEVRFHLSELRSALQDVESGTRGYLLTGQAVFLEPYLSARTTVATELALMRKLTADQPVQQRILRETEPFIATRLDFAAATVATFHRQGAAAAADMVRTGEGKKTMDEIIRRLHEMDGDVAMLTTSWQGESDEAVGLAFLVLPLGGMFSFGVFLTVLVLLNREIVGRYRVEQRAWLQSGALDAAANAIMITDRTGAIESVNATFTALSGYSSTEVIGRNPRELFKSGRQDPAVFRAMWETILAGRVWHGEVINRRKDGSHYPEEITITPVRDASGEVAHFIAIKQDITARTLAAEALVASEQRFRATFDQAAVGIAHVGLDGRFLKVNQRFAGIVDRSSEDLLECTFQQITHPDDLEADVGQVQRLLAGEIATYSMEKRYVRKDASVVWVNLTVALVRAEAGAPKYFIGVVEDIAARKRAEEALAQSEERYRLLFDRSPVPMWLYELSSLRVLAVNDAAVLQYGYARDEFLGLTLHQLHAPEDQAAMLEFLKHSPADVNRFSQWRHRKKDGTIIPVEISAGPLQLDGRDVRLVLANDITEKKLLEEKFFHAQRLESIGMLAAGVAHDLNNVLSPIMFIAPLLRASLSSERDLKTLEILEQSAARGAGLVKQILGFSHASTNELGPVHVKHIARDVISVVEQTFPKSIALQARIMPNLWPVRGNATQIHQVILNLCVNARDAMPDGGTLRITASNLRLDAAAAAAIPEARPGVWFLLEVGDNGTGIPPEIVERIWAPFFTTKGEGKGTGLGLSTVRGIAANHHGFVTMETKVGRGTTFRVYLPASETDLPDAAGTPVAEIPVGHGELILLVDDDASIRETAKDILERQGYTVMSCADGVQAIIVGNAHAGDIDLVLTDVDMPRLGGLAVARALRELRPAIPLIAMCGMSDEGSAGSDIPEIRKLAQVFLLKPFKPATLLREVHQLLHPTEKS